MKSLLEQVYSPFRLCTQEKATLAKLVSAASDSFVEESDAKEVEGVEEVKGVEGVEESEEERVEEEGGKEVEGEGVKGVEVVERSCVEEPEGGTQGGIETAAVKRRRRESEAAGSSARENGSPEDDDMTMESQHMEKQGMETGCSNLSSYADDGKLAESGGSSLDSVSEELDLSDVTPDMIDEFMSESREDAEKTTHPSLGAADEASSAGSALPGPLQTTLSQWSRGWNTDGHSKQVRATPTSALGACTCVCYVE